MRADMQRRDPRVPLGILVELTHEDFEEPFEADAIDVGPGGLGMRAAFLPDVGSRLTCRFSAPDDDCRVEAPCEVVWARDNGPHVGHVGLRFTSLDDSSRSAIERMVSRGDSQAEPPSKAQAPKPHLVEPYIEPEAVEGPDARVHLHLEGVDAAIPARVVARHAEGVRVVQQLGLFRLGTGVEVQNGERRRGRIDGVSIRADARVPELVLDVTYETDPEAGAERTSSEGPDTIPDAPAQEVSASEAIPVGSAERPSEPAAPVADAPPEVPFEDAPTPAWDVRIVRKDGTPASAAAEREFVSEAAERSPIAVGHRGVSTLRATMARARPELERAWVALRGLLAGVRPWLAALQARSRAVYARVAPGARRWLARVGSLLRRFLSVLAARIGARLPWSTPSTRKRRATAPPPARSNVARTQSKATPKARARKERARTLILSLAAFAGAAALVYALSPTSAEEVDTHRELSGETSRSDEGTADSKGSEAAGTPGGADETDEGTEESESKADHGDDEAPPPQEAGTVPPTSPYAAPEEPATEPQEEAEARAPELTQSFGAASLEDGRSFLLRMSQPVEAIRGVAEESGFSVIVPGSLSLDRAGPIAAAHPAVEKSMILNRGDHAELSIRFVDGKNPTYRVTPRGRAVEIKIGR